MLVSAAGHLLAALLVRLRLPDLAANAASSGSRSMVRVSLAANRRLLADGRILTLLLAQWLPPCFVTGAESLLIPYATGRGASVGTAGLLLACLPAGMIVGDLSVGRLMRPGRRERMTVPLLVVLGLPLMALATEVPLGVVAPLLVVSGSGFAYGLGLQRPFLEALPSGDRGAAFGLLSSGLMTLQGLGPVALGAAAEIVSVGPAMAVAGAATLATGALVAQASGSSISRRATAP